MLCYVFLVFNIFDVYLQGVRGGLHAFLYTRYFLLALS